MAQTKTIQLLRSSQLYVPSGSGSEAKTALENAKAALTALTGRKDGEIVLARYQEASGPIKSVLGIYHTSPDLGNGQGTDGADVTYSGGWTFIQDITSSTEGLTQLQAEIDRIETNVGLGNDGTYTSGYSSDEIVGTPTTLKATVDAIVTFIKTLDKAADAQNGQVVTTVTQTNGAVTETKANVKDLQLGEYSKDTSATGAIGSTDTVNTALSKLENAIAANDVHSDDQSITVTDDVDGGTNIEVNVDGTTIVKDATSHALKSGLTIAKITSGLGTNVKEAYQLQNASGTQIGTQIDIYKDSALKEVYLGASTDTIDASTGVITKNTVTDPQSMNFAYSLADGTYTLVKIDVSKFLSESEFGDGLQVSGGVVSVKVGNGLEIDGTSKAVNVKIDSTSESFLTVGANGVKLSGVQSAINAAIEGLDVTDTAVAGQYVSSVSETDGEISVSRANVSEAVLNNYAKGTAPDSLDIAATDTINQAIAKLEHQVDAVNAGVANLDAEVTSTDGTNVQVKVTEVDGVITAVNVTTDNTINATDLSNAINALDGSATATAASGNVYSVLTSVTETNGVISKGGEVTLAAVAKTGAAEDVSVAADATSGLEAGNVQDTLEALTAATNNGLDSVSSGNAAIAVGTKTNKSQTVSLVLDTTTTTGNITSDMLEINSNGLMMKDTWDCGTF